MLKRYLLPVSALLIATMVAGIAAVSFQRRLETFQPLGFAAVAQGSAFLVTELSREVGLAPGDVILLAQGREPRNAAELRQVLGASRSTELLVSRADALLPISYSRPPLEIDYGYLALALVGLLYLVIGVFSTVKDRERSSTTFFAWCIASALLFLASPRLPTIDTLDRAIFAADLVARLLLPALTLQFFLVFPLPLVRRRFLPYVLALIYLPSAALIAYHVDQMVWGGRMLGLGPASAGQLTRLDRLELVLFVAAGLLAAGLLFVRLARGERPGFETGSWEQRRQTWWIAAGLAGGAIPFTLFYLLPWTMAGRVSWWSIPLGVLPLALLPLAFAWAIFKFRLLDLGSILREAASYGITALLAIFGFQLAHLAIQSGLGEQTSLLRNLLTFAAGLTVAGVLVPARGVVADAIARLQFRRNWGARRMLGTLGQELLFERDLDRLCDTLIQSLADALRARVNLYLAQGEEGLVPFHIESGLPRAVGFELFGDEFWVGEVETISALATPGENTSAENRCYLEGYRYALPVTVRGRKLGFVLLGYRLDEEPFAGEDLDLVRGLLNQAALAIENAHLLDEIQQRLAEVSRLEAYNHGILESTPAGLALLDEEGRIVLANHAFAAIGGRQRALVPGSPVTDLLPVRPLPSPEDGLIEVSFCEPGGRERYFQLSTAISRTGEAGRDRVLIVQDITDQMTLENNLREKEHLASLGMLAAGVAHEVNTPLTGISSYAQFLLADTPPDDPRHAILKKMEKQTFRASEIVNSLLDFARNRRNDALSRLRLDTTVAETLGLLEERLRDADVVLALELPPEPVWVMGNEGELHQVLTNLVVNAAQAMEKQADARRLRVKLGERGGKAYLEVSDNGPGIPPDRLDTIFKPFFSSKLGSGGSGLGLAISYNIVRRHAGNLTVHNHPGSEQGCTFLVELPCRPTIH